MIESIEDRHEVKIRKRRQCHNCERVFDTGATMVASVWKEDYIYRLYECTDCMDWIDKNGDLYHELCVDESLYPGWIKEVEPLPNFLQK